METKKFSKTLGNNFPSILMCSVLSRLTILGAKSGDLNGAISYELLYFNLKAQHFEHCNFFPHPFLVNLLNSVEFFIIRCGIYLANSSSYERHPMRF